MLVTMEEIKTSDNELNLDQIETIRKWKEESINCPLRYSGKEFICCDIGIYRPCGRYMDCNYDTCFVRFVNRVSG